LIGFGVALVLGLLFGRKLLPYASTAFHKVRQTVNDQVPLSFQLDAARKQVSRIDSDVRDMLWQIAREEVAIKQLEGQVVAQKGSLEQQHAGIMKLRHHLDSGDTHFVVHGASYSNDRVREDLRNRFEVYKTTEQTIEKIDKILEARRQGLESAKAKLEQTVAERRNLEVEIEHLEARMKMIDVAKTASQLNLDNSQLSRTRGMIDDIKSRLDVEEQMLNLAPNYMGGIPLEGEQPATNDDQGLLEEIDAYFGSDPDLVRK
jgi:chromosome segregation ATPase